MTHRTCRLAAMAVTLAFGFGHSAHALIITTGNGQGNTSAPLDDPGFANLGSGGVGTVVYLGNRMVLTAHHVGSSVVANQLPVNFGGNYYTPVANSGVRLQNPDNSFTDLLVFEIDSDPGLPALNIAATAPTDGTGVTMIGRGLSRATNQTYWDVNTAVPGNWVWTEVGSTDPWDATGYKSGSSSAMRWGTNNIADNDFDFVLPNGPVQGMITVFNSLPDEGHAAAGDSGGALFAKNTSTNQWELAGIMLAITNPSTWSNVPSNAAILGGSVTLSADLSAYRSQIIALVPEPASVALSAMGLAALAVCGWKRRRRIGR